MNGEIDIFGKEILPDETDKNVFNQLDRVLTESNQELLFDTGPDWEKEWWGMPEFSMGDASPQYTMTVSFLTATDRAEFAKKLGITITPNTRSTWYPPQDRLEAGAFMYTGPKTDSKYPVCIPSKGRADCQTTGKALDKLGVSYKFFVEETEGDIYKQYLGSDKVVVMPFHDLGLGSIPARNFIWEWAKERGHKRHWTVDDNLGIFKRTHLNRRLGVHGGGIFRAMEDFVDRYDNVVMAGPHNVGFVPDRVQFSPFLFNSRVYSCILLDTSLPDRWRGRYNEDTDLSLRLLKQGYCTMLFRSLIMDKGTTVGCKDGSSAMKGGNKDNVYNTDDHRLKFAESLKEQHPDVVEVTWKFGRWHHQVNYASFKNNKPILRAGITPTVGFNNYGMELIHKPAER